MTVVTAVPLGCVGSIARGGSFGCPKFEVVLPLSARKLVLVEPPTYPDGMLISCDPVPVVKAPAIPDQMSEPKPPSPAFRVCDAPGRLSRVEVATYAAGEIPTCQVVDEGCVFVP
jgi:hypothetical protein